MEQNKLNFILIIFNIIIFISYFIFSNLYIRPDMNDKLKLAQEYTMKEKWKQAEKVSIDIEKDWSKKKFFIMCNYGESEFDSFEGHINDITGGIKAEDVASSITSILSAQDAWKNLNKIIPSP